MAKFKTKDAEGKEIEVDIEITQDNIPKEVKDQIIKSAQGIAYGNVDTVAEKFGFKKPEGIEKTSDFIEYILKTAKEQKAELEKAVEDAKKGGNTPEEVTKLQEELATLRKITENQKKEIETKDQTYKQLIRDSKIDSELAKIDIAVPANITEEADIKFYKQAQLELIKNKLVSSYEIKFEDNGTYRILKGNEAELNASNELASISDIAQRDFKAWIAKPGQEKPSGGTGGQGNPGGDPPKLKTFEDVAAAAVSKGYTTGSPEWAEFVDKTTTELGIE